ncbi:MAG TPA: hypothetical protein VIL25_11015, partial [Vicinamibacterales bacterium]
MKLTLVDCGLDCRLSCGLQSAISEAQIRNQSSMGAPALRGPPDPGEWAGGGGEAPPSARIRNHQRARSARQSIRNKFAIRNPQSDTLPVRFSLE